MNKTRTQPNNAMSTLNGKKQRNNNGRSVLMHNTTTNARPHFHDLNTKTDSNEPHDTCTRGGAFYEQQCAVLAPTPKTCLPVTVYALVVHIQSLLQQNKYSSKEERTARIFLTPLGMACIATGVEYQTAETSELKNKVFEFLACEASKVFSSELEVITEAWASDSDHVMRDKSWHETYQESNATVRCEMLDSLVDCYVKQVLYILPNGTPVLKNQIDDQDTAHLPVGGKMKMELINKLEVELLSIVHVHCHMDLIYIRSSARTKLNAVEWIVKAIANRTSVLDAERMLGMVGM